MEKKQIDKPWCLYGGNWWWGFGKIIEEHEGVVWVKCSEKDELRPWATDYVKRFNTLKETIEEYARYKGRHISKVQECARYYFPNEKID